MPNRPYQLPEEIVFPDDQEDIRLDVAIKGIFSALSLREIRRILSNHHLKLNGRRAMKGSLVKAGDRLELIPHSPEDHLKSAGTFAEKHISGEAPTRHPHHPEHVAHHTPLNIPRRAADNDAPQWGEGPTAVHVIKQSDRFAALFKPAGLHSVELKNRGGDSLEELLAETWTEHFAAAPILLNRLDLLTSGIVLAAFSQDVVKQYQNWEAAGLINKTYYALVHGTVPDALKLTRALDMDSRIKTRALPKDDPDPRRHTVAQALTTLSGEACAALIKHLKLAHNPESVSLLKINIQRGARHQIRAHLSAAGYPIVGDHLYGSLPGKIMYLHHAAISLPDFEAHCPPPWPPELLEYLTRGAPRPSGLPRQGQPPLDPEIV